MTTQKNNGSSGDKGGKEAEISKFLQDSPLKVAPYLAQEATVQAQQKKCERG